MKAMIVLKSLMLNHETKKPTIDRMYVSELGLAKDYTEEDPNDPGKLVECSRGESEDDAYIFDLTNARDKKTFDGIIESESQSINIPYTQKELKDSEYFSFSLGVEVIILDVEKPARIKKTATRRR